MKRYWCSVVAAAWLVLAIPAHAAEGVTAVKSPYGVKETLDRWAAAAERRELKMFSRVDDYAAVPPVTRALAALAAETTAR
ncbi:MAG: hypothetical protein ABI533_01610 [Betaproteobacteria bacterium]